MSVRTLGFGLYLGPERLLEDCDGSWIIFGTLQHQQCPRKDGAITDLFHDHWLTIATSYMTVVQQPCVFLVNQLCPLLNIS